jgi:HSP20 family protein
MMTTRTNGESFPVIRRAPRRAVSLLDDFFEHPIRGFDPWLWPTRRWRRPWAADEWFPDVDVLERDGKLIVRADLPGIKRDDINVKVEGDTLTISGRREEKAETKDTDYYRSERQTGAFTRVVRLPEGSGADQVEATYHDGVLEVVVPKPAVPTPKSIEVRVN